MTAAETLARERLDGNPLDVTGSHVLAAVSLAKGHVVGALSHAAMAYALAPGNHEVRNTLAVALMNNDRRRHAVPHLQAICSERPDYENAWSNYLGCLLELAEFENAVTAVGEWMQQYPDSETAKIQAIRVFGMARRFDDAVAIADTISRDSPHAMKALDQKAVALAEMGQMDQAREAFRTVIEHQPTNGTAHHALSSITRFDRDSSLIAVFEGFANRVDSLPDADRIAGHYALGKMYDDLENTDQAFAHWSIGARLRRSQYDYDVRSTTEMMRRICEVSTEATLHKSIGIDTSGFTPIFVVGMPRSGTTLVEQMLDHHSQIGGAGETVDLYRAVSGIRIGGYTVPSSPMGPAPGSTLSARGDWFRTKLRTIAPNFRFVIDKQPMNFQFIGLASILLPNARFIHICRDPLDTCFSCFTQHFVHAINWSFDLVEIAQYYVSYREAMAHWQAVAGDRIHSLSYEKLVADPEAHIRQILSFLTLPFEPDCLDFHTSNRPVSTASLAQVREPLSDRRIGRAQRYRHHLGPMISVLEKAGIDTTGTSINSDVASPDREEA